MSRNRKELLPSLEEIRAMLRREKQGIADTGTEKAIMRELWIARTLKDIEETYDKNQEDEELY